MTKNSSVFQLVSEHEARLINAMKSSNVDELDKLIHDDLIFSVPSGKSVDKKADLIAYRSGKMKVDVLDVLERDMVDYDSCIAVSVVVKLEGSYDGKAFNGRFRFLRVWKCEGGNCQVITGGSHHLS